jgi:hypothetical protein
MREDFKRALVEPWKDFPRGLLIYSAVWSGVISIPFILILIVAFVKWTNGKCL